MGAAAACRRAQLAAHASVYQLEWIAQLLWIDLNRLDQLLWIDLNRLNRLE